MLVPSYLGGDCSILLSYGDAAVSIPRRVIERKTPFIETEAETRIPERDSGPGYRGNGIIDGAGRRLTSAARH